MANLVHIRLNRKKPLICVPCAGATVGDICYQCQQIKETPHDLFNFDASSFNGLPNLSQLWNALLMIAQVTEESEPYLFSCPRSALPEFCTDEDHRNILTFAVRSGMADMVEMEADTDLDEDFLADLSEQAQDAGIIPVLAVSFAVAPSAEEVTSRLEALTNLEARVIHLRFPAAAKNEIVQVQTSIREFLLDNYEYRVIIEPTGPLAKKELLAGNTFDSPILYARFDQETPDFTTSARLEKVLTAHQKR